MIKKIQLLSTCAFVTVILVTYSFSLAQTSESTNAENLVTIESKPAGAIVKVKGLYSFVGKTPYVVPYPLEGEYKIKASKTGYESETSVVDFSGQGGSDVVIRLRPKTRLKAAIRSVAFPGWGQIYGGDKLRGVIISVVQVGLGIGSALAVHEYNQSNAALERAVAAFDRNMNEENFQIVQQRLVKADDDYDFRNTMFYITAGFWIYNIFDSFVFFSPPGSQVEIQVKPPSSASNNSQFMLSWKIGL